MKEKRKKERAAAQPSLLFKEKKDYILFIR